VAVAFWSTLKAVGILRRLEPDVVVGFGGYVSIPVGLAAVVRHTPLVIHEQNSVPGLANRLLSRWACRVAVTYEGSSAYLKHPGRSVVTGNPVRPAVLGASRDRGRRIVDAENGDVVLLVFGGSRGARHINRAVVAASERILALENVRVLHIAGRAEYDSASADLAAHGGEAGGRWSVHDYIEDMGSCIAGADLIVARAGATSLAEITAIGRAAVLVPYPYATDDHQTLNAKAVSERGGAVMIEDSALDGPDFASEVVRLLADATSRATMAAASERLGRPEAARLVAAVISEAVGSSAKEGTE